MMNRSGGRQSEIEISSKNSMRASLLKERYAVIIIKSENCIARREGRGVSNDKLDEKDVLCLIKG